MNVYTTEVEAVLAQLDDVAQVAVIGIPDDDWGEAVAAVVVPRGELDHDRLDAHARAHLAAYKRPKRIEVVDTIAVTPFGKPDKKALRARYWDGAERRIS